MVYTTLNIDATKESIIVVVIQPENLRRIRNADPITLESERRGGIMQPVKYPDQLSLLIAYENDEDEVYKRVRTGNLGELLEWLERGRRFIPGVDGKEQSFTIPHD